MRGRVLAAFVLVLTALSVALGAVLQTSRSATPRPAPVAQRSAADDIAAATALQAYDILYGNYVDQPQSEALIAGGWNAALAAAQHAGVHDKSLPDRPPATESELHADLLQLFEASTGRVSSDDLATDAAVGMARSLHDDHTGFVPARTWQAQQAGNDLSLGYHGVRTPQGLLVWETLPGSPADRAGIHPGDLITAVDGQALADTARPPSPGAGVPSRISVSRDGRQIDLGLTPENAPLLTFNTRLLDDGIAYIRVYSFFTPSTPDAVRDYLRLLDGQLDKLRAQQPVGWVLDMRNNSGGNEALAANLAARLGLTGPLTENRDRNGTLSVIPSNGRSITDGKPVAVLVNETSASAAEMVAAALQDASAGRVFGVRTPGLVNTARFFPLDGGAMEVTTARAYVGEKKRVLDRVGVTPDETVVLDGAALAQGHDSQLDRATDYLLTQARAATP